MAGQGRRFQGLRLQTLQVGKYWNCVPSSSTCRAEFSESKKAETSTCFPFFSSLHMNSMQLWFCSSSAPILPAVHGDDTAQFWSITSLCEGFCSRMTSWDLGAPSSAAMRRSVLIFELATCFDEKVAARGQVHTTYDDFGLFFRCGNQKAHERIDCVISTRA
jgi:hypothetical protein